MKSLTHLQRQYIKWCKYVRMCKDDKKKDKLFKQALWLSKQIGRQRQ